MALEHRISELDTYLFAKGTHYEIYEKMGAHLAEEDGKAGTYFSVWAPNARSVSVAENGVKFEPDKQFRKEHKGILGVVQEKHTVRMTLKRYVRVEKIKGILQESLPAFLDMLRMEGFTNGCELCGEMRGYRVELYVFMFPMFP